MAAMSMLAVTFFALQSEPTIDWLKLPDAKSLTRFAERACTEHRLKTGEVPEWPQRLVAQAHVYNREFRRARRVAQPLTGVWRATFETTVVQVEYEQTGSIVELPLVGTRQLSSDSTDDEIWDVITIAGLAKGLASAGQFEQARIVLKSVEDSRGFKTILMDHLIEAARMQIERNDKDGANRSLTECMTLRERLRKSSFRFVEQIISVAELWQRLGKAEEAVQAAEMLHCKLKSDEEEEGAFYFNAKGAARLGRFFASIGNRERSSAAFREALRLAEDAFERASKENPNYSDMERKHFVGLLAQIAAWQFESGWQTEADQTMNRVLTEMEMKGDPNHIVERPSTGSLVNDMILSQFPPTTMGADRDYQLLGLVGKLAPSRYRQAILRIVSEMKGDYWKLCGLRDWSRSDPSAGSVWEPILSEIESRVTTLASAEERASRLTIIAEIRSVANDAFIARKAFTQAISASSQTESRTQHQEIARIQIRSGYFEDAFTTIGKIPDAENRLLPLGELALAVAKREFESKKR